MALIAILAIAISRSNSVEKRLGSSIRLTEKKIWLFLWPKYEKWPYTQKRHMGSKLSDAFSTIQKWKTQT